MFKNCGKIVKSNMLSPFPERHVYVIMYHFYFALCKKLYNLVLEIV